MNEQKTEAIAQVCHELNRAYCIYLADESQPHWEDAPAWQTESALECVQAALENPDITPELSHEGWLKKKASEGWSYGPVKDPEKKEHPCFRPYEELPPEQRAKDFLFIGIVRLLSEAMEQYSPGSDQGESPAIKPEPSPIMKYFVYGHLPRNLQSVSSKFKSVAEFVDKLPSGAEKSTALRKLLEGKDAAVRAAIEQ